MYSQRSHATFEAHQPIAPCRRLTKDQHLCRPFADYIASAIHLASFDFTTVRLGVIKVNLAPDTMISAVV